jgi:transaldolase
MKIFLDTADILILKNAYNSGLIDGVTTNPSLILQSGQQPHDVYQQLQDLGIKDISAEVVGESAEEFLLMAEEYINIGPEITIKVPCTEEGLKACKVLSDRGVRVNVTLIFSVAQAILSAKAGATYVSPFVGRCIDNKIDGIELIASISEAYIIHDISTQILAASIRDVDMAVNALLNGADIITIPPIVFNEMFKHHLTDEGLEIFNRDWIKVKQKV